MKKTVLVLGSLLALWLGACQGIFTPTPGPVPTVDSAGTADALFETAVAQTLTARPTLPFDSVTDTATLPVESPVLPATDTPTAPLPVETFTPVVDQTTIAVTGTSEVPTATGVPGNGTPTATTTLAAGQVTAVWTLAVRKYGTLPPEVPFARLTLINKAKAEAYISLQVTMNDGRFSILEYPVKGSVKIDAPVGSYLYVAWVGGNKIVGNFRLHQTDDLVITLYKDKVAVK